MYVDIDDVVIDILRADTNDLHAITEKAHDHQQEPLCSYLSPLSTQELIKYVVCMCCTYLRASAQQMMRNFFKLYFL